MMRTNTRVRTADREIQSCANMLVAMETHQKQKKFRQNEEIELNGRDLLLGAKTIGLRRGHLKIKGALQIYQDPFAKGTALLISLLIEFEEAFQL